MSIKSEDSVVPQSEVNELMKRIKKLEQVLGQKTLENEILREAIQIGREKNSSRDNPGKEWKISNKSDCSNFGNFTF